MRSTEISVVITTRDRPDFLARALESVLRQSLAATAIIVVDDGSERSPESLIESFECPAISLVRHQRSRGAPAARNTGLARATTEFIAFLDDDDHWEAEKLKKQLACLHTAPGTVAGVFCYSTQWSPLDPGWLLQSRTPRLRLEFEDFLEKTYFGTSIPLLRRQRVAEAGGFDENLVAVQDRDLWLRLTRRGSFIGVPEVLAHRAIHGDQITSNLPLKIKGREQLLAKYRQDLLDHPRWFSEHLWKLGLMYCAAGHCDQGQARLSLAVATDPNNPGPKADLEHSQRQPEAHAQLLVTERFNRVGEVVLYY